MFIWRKAAKHKTKLKTLRLKHCSLDQSSLWPHNILQVCWGTIWRNRRRRTEENKNIKFLQDLKVTLMCRHSCSQTKSGWNVLCRIIWCILSHTLPVIRSAGLQVLSCCDKITAEKLPFSAALKYLSSFLGPTLIQTWKLEPRKIFLVNLQL